MGSFVETEEIPQHLTCPVCFELPKAEVYQCRDGHMLCKSCYFQVEDCPQCRIPFDKQQPIRCRPIEEVLNGFWTECPFKSNGCSERVLKIHLENHVDACYYDFARFGELVNMCKDFGSITCDFKFNKGNGKEAVDHLITNHGLKKTNSNFSMELKSFKESAKGGSTGFTFWKPVIVELKLGFLVVASALQRKDASFTTWSVFLQDSNKENNPSHDVEVEYSVKHVESSGSDSWTRKPFSLDSKQPFPRRINFHFNSIGFLPHLDENESLVINVKILENGVLKDGEVERVACIKRIILTLTTSLTPALPVRFDRFVASYEAKNFYKEIKYKCLQNRRNLLPEIRKVYWGFIPEGLELLDLEWLATELIFMAAQYGTIEAVKYLIERKVNFNIYSAHNGSTPLHLAVMDTDNKIGLEKAKLLVECGGADVTVLDDRNNSVLHIAALYGNDEIVEYFIQKGLNVNGANRFGQTPIFSAVLNNVPKARAEISTILFQNGARLDIKDEYGKTSEDLAIRYKSKTLKKDIAPILKSVTYFI